MIVLKVIEVLFFTLIGIPTIIVLVGAVSVLELIDSMDKKRLPSGRRIMDTTFLTLNETTKRVN